MYHQLVACKIYVKSIKNIQSSTDIHIRAYIRAPLSYRLFEFEPLTRREDRSRDQFKTARYYTITEITDRLP